MGLQIDGSEVTQLPTLAVVSRGLEKNGGHHIADKKIEKMAWRRSYDFTLRMEESEFDSSDESDSEGGAETINTYHRRKSTVTAVKSKVSFHSFELASADIFEIRMKWSASILNIEIEFEHSWNYLDYL